MRFEPATEPGSVDARLTSSARRFSEACHRSGGGGGRRRAGAGEAAPKEELLVFFVELENLQDAGAGVFELSAGLGIVRRSGREGAESDSSSCSSRVKVALLGGRVAGAGDVTELAGMITLTSFADRADPGI